MSRVRFSVLGMLAFAASVGACQQETKEGGQTSAEDSTASADSQAEAEDIRDVAQRIAAGYRTRNADSVAAHYAEDVIVVTSRGVVHEGREAARNALVGFFASVLAPGAEVAWTLRRVGVSSAGDMAHEVGSWRTTLPGGQVVAQGNYLYVWQKIHGEWKATRYASILADSAAAP